MSSFHAFSLFSPFRFGSIFLDKNKPYMCHIYVFLLFVGLFVFSYMFYSFCSFPCDILTSRYKRKVSRSYIVTYMYYRQTNLSQTLARNLVRFEAGDSLDEGLVAPRSGSALATGRRVHCGGVSWWIRGTCGFY